MPTPNSAIPTSSSAAPRSPALSSTVSFSARTHRARRRDRAQVAGRLMNARMPGRTFRQSWGDLTGGSSKRVAATASSMINSPNRQPWCRRQPKVRSVFSMPALRIGAIWTTGCALGISSRNALTANRSNGSSLGGSDGNHPQHRCHGTVRGELRRRLSHCGRISRQNLAWDHVVPHDRSRVRRRTRQDHRIPCDREGRVPG